MMQTTKTVVTNKTSRLSVKFLNQKVHLNTLVWRLTLQQ